VPVHTSAPPQAGAPAGGIARSTSRGCLGLCRIPEPNQPAPLPAAQTHLALGPAPDPAVCFALAAMTASAIAAAAIWPVHCAVIAVRASSGLARAAYLDSLAELGATTLVLAVALIGVLGFWLARPLGWLVDAAQVSARIMLTAAGSVTIVVSVRDRGHVEAAGFALLFAAAACVLIDLAARVAQPTGTPATDISSAGNVERSDWRACVGAVAVARVPSAHAIAACLWCSASAARLGDLTWSLGRVAVECGVRAVPTSVVTVKTLRSRVAGATQGSRTAAYLNLAEAAGVPGMHTCCPTTHPGLIYAAAATPALIRRAAPVSPPGLDRDRLPSRQQPSPSERDR